MEEAKKKRLVIVIIGVLVFILIVGILFINFAIVNLIYSNKKMEMPRILSEFAVQKDYVSYFIQEIGEGKIHKKPLSGELPRINTVIKDIGKTFTTEIDNSIGTYEGIIGNSDIQIELNRKLFFEIIKAQNKQEIMKNKKNEIKIELKNSRGELASKGYKNLLKNFDENVGFFDLISEEIYTKDIMILLMLMLICSITIIYVMYY